jgi:hypothetical protein
MIGESQLAAEKPDFLSNSAYKILAKRRCLFGSIVIDASRIAV